MHRASVRSARRSSMPSQADQKTPRMPTRLGLRPDPSAIPSFESEDWRQARRARAPASSPDLQYERDCWFGLTAPTGPCCSLLDEHEPADGLRCPTTRLGARRLLERPADAVVPGVGRDEWCSSVAVAPSPISRTSASTPASFAGLPRRASSPTGGAPRPCLLSSRHAANRRRSGECRIRMGKQQSGQADPATRAQAVQPGRDPGAVAGRERR